MRSSSDDLIQMLVREQRTVERLAAELDALGDDSELSSTVHDYARRRKQDLIDTLSR